MAPKKVVKKKNSKAIGENESSRIYLTLEDMKAKELIYSNRLTSLKKCIHFMDDAVKEIRILNEEELLKTKWETFLSCHPLPKPYIPSDIRRFYSKIKYQEKENMKENLNWMLSVDEKSILTQDFNAQDLTRRTLNTKFKNIGAEYKDHIRDSLKILQKIKEFLNNDSEVAKCPMDILNDVVERKWAIQNEITDLIDRFTYRIISSENAYMQSIDSISAEYTLNADDFKIHIWCLKNVAIRISYLREPRLLANFHSIKLVLHIPAQMLKENLVIRATHMKFDHFSEHAKSFSQTKPVSTDNLNAGIQDLQKCLINEWFMQMEIQAKVRQELMQQRLQYEEEMQKYKEELEKDERRNKNDKNKTKRKKKITKLVKPSNEPTLLTNDMFPDIYDEFLQQEQQQYEDFIKAFYEPRLFNISADEINLRKNLILGGIYQIYYVKKPMQNDFESFNMTWHYNGAKLDVNKDVKISRETDLLQQSQLSLFRRRTLRMTIFEAETEYTDPNVTCPLFIVTIELPQHLCFWGEPIPCHFEETTQQVKKSPPSKIQETQKNINNNETKPGSPFDSALINTFDTSLQPDLNSYLNLQDKLSLQRKRLAASQEIFRDSYFRDSLAKSLLYKRQSESSASRAMNSLCIKDFLLTDIPTTPQIRNMENHIIPRIISSYKFPKEIQLEDLEMLRKKPKRRKGGRIIRPKNEEVPPKLSTRQFTFTERQNNPERIYAKYPKVFPITMISLIEKFGLENDQNQPQTFADLLQLVDNIKQKYFARKNTILDLKPLQQHIVTHNKRIKQMLRKRDISTSRDTPTIAIPRTKRSNQRSIQFDRKHLSESEKVSLFEDNLSMNNTGSNVADTEQMTDTEEKIDNEQKTHTEQESELESYWHWTTKYISKSEFDRKNHKIVLHTNRLGNIGFAFKRYEHFPFKCWSMEPNKEDPDNEVIFTLDTRYARCVFNLTANGIRGHVTELSNKYVRKPKMYLVIENPIKDLKEFKQLLKENNLNIFAEHDASFYIENGDFSEKHLSNELHTYNCMAVHSTQMLFNFSQWNRLAKRRDIILHVKQYQDLAENLVQVRITPGEAFFVEIHELCSEDLNVIKLDYNLTWRNIETYSDLHNLIVSMYPSATDMRCKNPKMICCIRDLLSEIRPLSFS